VTAQELQDLIGSGLSCAHLHVQGDGRHWYATLVSAEFEGKRLIQRHQRVYATLGNRMVTDEVHALSMRTYSPSEWEKMSDAEKAGT
jgi:acid stress-induced BolA-like protein IbaG/YrbA